MNNPARGSCFRQSPRIQRVPSEVKRGFVAILAHVPHPWCPANVAVLPIMWIDGPATKAMQQMKLRVSLFEDGKARCWIMKAFDISASDLLRERRFRLTSRECHQADGEIQLGVGDMSEAAASLSNHEVRNLTGKVRLSREKPC